MNKNNEIPTLDRILRCIEERDTFARMTRYEYMGGNYDIENALKIVEAIGKTRKRNFVIDAENRFTYENFIKWCHCDPTMKQIHPDTREVVPGNLYAGIYIGGTTGSGKSWCLEIMRAYASALGFKISIPVNYEKNETRTLAWRIVRADEICETFAEDGNITELKKTPIIAIQDLGQEQEESLHMGNRVDAVRQLLEFRGDLDNELTLITSNLPMGSDRLMARYGDRVASRLHQMCNNLVIKGKDRRKY